MGQHDDGNGEDVEDAYYEEDEAAEDADPAPEQPPVIDSKVIRLSPRVVAVPEEPRETENSRGYDDDAHIKLEHSAKIWMLRHNVYFDVASNSFFWEEGNLSIKELAKQLHVSKTWRDDRGILHRQTESQWATVLTRVARNQRNAMIAVIRNGLCNVPRTSDAELRRFLRELLHSNVDGEEFENCVAVIKHWLWLVQRQVLNLKTVWHMMPIFWGGGGGGKSEQVKLLLKPVGVFANLDANFTVFTDGFSQLQMHRAFVMFMDEMENADKTDSQAIKRAISAEHISGRGMHSDDGRKLRRNASFIAATNTPPPHGLKDDSTARRYYSLECRPGPITPERIAFFKSLDYVAMWTCVNPHVNQSPMMPRQAQIMAVQSAVNRSRSVFEDFIAERCEKVEGAVYLYKDFVRDLKGYIEDRKLLVTVPSYVQLRIELKALGWMTTNPNNVPRVVGLVNRTTASMRAIEEELYGTAPVLAAPEAYEK